MRWVLDSQNLNLQVSHSPWWFTGPFLNTHSYSTCSRAITPVRPGAPATFSLCWYGAVTYTLAIHTPLQMQIIVLLFMQNINLGTCLLLRKVPSFKTSASSSAVSEDERMYFLVNAFSYYAFKVKSNLAFSYSLKEWNLWPFSLAVHRLNRGTQREYNSKPLKHSIVKRILVFKRKI